MTTQPPDAIMRAVDAGALVAVNVSGGKDGDASAITVSKYVPPAQQLHIHSTLGESEWPGALEHARDTAAKLGAPFMVVESKHTFLSMVQARFDARPEVPSFPSPAFRLCTSTLKRDVLNPAIKRYAKARGHRIIVNVMGLRAEESRKRAAHPTCVERPEHALTPRTYKNGNTREGRTWLDFLPIHDLRTDEVFGMISDAGIKRHHAYDLGNERVSCVFCIMGCQSDAKIGAFHNPALYQKYARMEKKTGWSMHPSRKTLPEITGIPILPDDESVA